jgi:hypothetical protein
VSDPGAAAQTAQTGQPAQGRQQAATARGEGGLSGSSSAPGAPGAGGASGGQAGAQNDAGAGVRGSASWAHGGASEASAAAGSVGSQGAAAAQPGALQGALAQTSYVTSGSEASPLYGAAAAQAGSAAAGTGAGPGAAPTLASGVAMQDMIDSIRATVEIAARQGMTQARIALQPEDLGHISIRLSQTSEGLLARVSAETPAAAQALMAGRAELHQSLSSLGLSLLRLDISSFGQSQTGERDGSFAGDTGEGGGSGTPGGSGGAEEVEGAAPLGAGEEGAAASATISGGELVDVLA